jgi:hypothetical protein
VLLPSVTISTSTHVCAIPQQQPFFVSTEKKRNSCLFFRGIDKSIFLEKGSRSCIILCFSDKCKIIVVGQLRVTISCSSCVYVCLRTFLQFHFESLSLLVSDLLLLSLCRCCLCFCVVSVHYFGEKINQLSLSDLLEKWMCLLFYGYDTVGRTSCWNLIDS